MNRNHSIKSCKAIFLESSLGNYTCIPLSTLPSSCFILFLGGSFYYRRSLLNPSSSVVGHEADCMFQIDLQILKSESCVVRHGIDCMFQIDLICTPILSLVESHHSSHTSYYGLSFVVKTKSHNLTASSRCASSFFVMPLLKTSLF